MSDKGYLVIAQNNDTCDYIRQAYALGLSIINTQSSVKKLSVAVTSPEDVLPKYRKIFDEIITIPFDDDAAYSDWKIENKWKYYHISPYKETVILDTDMIFTNDISYWWDILQTRDIWSCSNPLTFRGERIIKNHYRKPFEENNLPNIYSAFFYFKKCKLASEFFCLLNNIFKNWHEYYNEFLDKFNPGFLSGDVAFAIAAKILKIEDLICENNYIFPTFVHMKSYTQNTNISSIGVDWTEHLHSTFTDYGEIFVSNYLQYYPFHYTIDDWLTEEIIKKLETIYESK